MPEQFKQNPATISKYQGMQPKTEEEKKKVAKYLKLAKRITDVVPHKLLGLTTDDPEFWGLMEVLSEDEVDVALTMKQRKWCSQLRALNLPINQVPLMIVIGN